MAQAEALLDEAKFVRIHRSFVVKSNGSPVSRAAAASAVAVLADGRRLPVSRSGFARLSALV
jgi:two-component system LytT family response regulator